MLGLYCLSSCHWCSKLMCDTSHTTFDKFNHQYSFPRTCMTVFIGFEKQVRTTFSVWKNVMWNAFNIFFIKLKGVIVNKVILQFKIESRDNCTQRGLVLPQPSSKNVVIHGVRILVLALLRRLQKASRKTFSYIFSTTWHGPNGIVGYFCCWMFHSWVLPANRSWYKCFTCDVNCASNGFNHDTRNPNVSHTFQLGYSINQYMLIFPTWCPCSTQSNGFYYAGIKFDGTIIGLRQRT